MNVRQGRESDAEAIARIQVAAWKVAYRDILPKRYLDALNPMTDLQNGRDTWVATLTKARSSS